MPWLKNKLVTPPDFRLGGLPHLMADAGNERALFRVLHRVL